MWITFLNCYLVQKQIHLISIKINIINLENEIEQSN